MPETINNAFYEELGERWYSDDTHAIALLRAETPVRVQYVLETLRRHNILPHARILDLGCGAGLMSNPIADAGYRVTGIDQSDSSLRTARLHAPPANPPLYTQGDILGPTTTGELYDVVMAMDVLEHVEHPRRVLEVGAGALRKGGLFFLHTFNRTMLSNLLAVKGMRWVVRDCPENIHIFELFVRPEEIAAWAPVLGLEVIEFQGMRPRLFSFPFVSTALSRKVHPRLEFVLTPSLQSGYLGCLRKA